MNHEMIDTAALAHHRRRASSDAMFLHAAAADEIQHRLELVNRSFTSLAVITGFPQFWGSRYPDAKIVADEDTLALQPGAHDLILHSMALHWANDPVGQLIQCKRALRPDGLLIAISFGGQTLHELRRCLTQAEIANSGGISPRVAPMAELRDLGGLLQRAGVALPVADTVKLSVTYRDIWHLMKDLRAMGEANALKDRVRQTTKRSLFETANTLYHQHFGTADGRITATFELVVLTGWAPAENQPKPLRPGSAQARLADALATQEQPLPD